VAAQSHAYTALENWVPSLDFSTKGQATWVNVWLSGVLPEGKLAKNKYGNKKYVGLWTTEDSKFNIQV
jgi:hypothetical protein